MKSSILCLGAIIQLVLANPVKIPLYKRSDFVSTETQNLQNGMMGAVVQIGNPPQNLTMAFDTTTGFSWVTETQCGDANCQGRTAFNTRNSSTITSTGQSFTMDYGDGTVNTTIYLDTFRYGGLTVKNMPFGGAYRMEGFNKGFDGYLGLGRNINLNTSQTQYAKRDDLSVSGFVPNAFQQGSGIASAQFGMYTITSGSGFSQSGTVSASFALDSGNLSPVKRFDYSCQEPDGYLIIGGVDKDAIKGKFYHIDIDDDANSGSWEVPVKKVRFKDDLKFDVSKKAKAVLSSSTDVIGLPNKQAEEFRKHWYAEYDKPDNTFKIPCCLMDRLTSFEIQLGDIKAVIPPQYWSHPRNTTTCCDMCRSHIGRSESDTDYVIGSSFTNAFYSDFDPEKERVSLALKKHQPDDGLELQHV